MMPENGIFSLLDSYFDKLDRASISNKGMFQTENDKGKYETTLMSAFRKYMAAEYHYRNVQTFLKEEAVDGELFSLDQDELPSVKSTFWESRDANHYAYELSAFLEALKSSIDFLATACILHLEGVRGDSISTLMKIAQQKNKAGPIIIEVKSNLDWLTRLRTYRHHLIHRIMIRTISGYEKREVEDVSKTIMYPVMIPESLPAYIPDTRKSRSMIPDISELYDSSETVTRDSNGRLIHYSVNLQPPAGFVSIDSFMASHLIVYTKFFNDVINRLSDLDFRVIST